MPIIDVGVRAVFGHGKGRGNGLELRLRHGRSAPFLVSDLTYRDNYTEPPFDAIRILWLENARNQAVFGVEKRWGTERDVRARSHDAPMRPRGGYNQDGCLELFGCD